MSPSDTYEAIAKELYSKNLDLVHANKLFELIQKLYEVMVTSYSIESLSQHFIDIIQETLGFTDAVVTARYEKNEHLRVVGITQTQINKTLLELANTATVNLRFDLSATHNALVRTFLSGKAETVEGISEIWSPYITRNDIGGIDQIIGPQRILVYPILFGDRPLGSFALFLGKRSADLTEFEKKALERLVIVFGVAIDRVRIHIELRDAEKRELGKTKELLKLKDEFVFIATHDLKTPVTAISGFVELLEHGSEPLSQRTKESLEAIRESSDRLNQLTNDLLEVARGDSGTIVIEAKKTDVVGVINDVIQEITPAAKEKHISVHAQLDATHRFVLADKAKLSEVIENLLSNAVKYNKKGGRIDVSTVLEGPRLRIRVVDSGYGIPVDKQDKVFQKFFRARQKGTEEVGGTGLGLFVVRMLIEKMGGTISFISRQGEGSTFTFYLPTTSLA